MFVAEGLKADSDNDGWVKGWGVIRNAPWHLQVFMRRKMLQRQKQGCWVMVMRLATAPTGLGATTLSPSPHR